MVYRLILLCNGLLGERNKYLQNIQFTNVDAYAKIQTQTNNYAHFLQLNQTCVPEWRNRQTQGT